MKTIIGVVIKDSAGKVFKGEKPKRHAHLIIEMSDFYGDEQIPKIVFQGFYTNTDEILSREDAYVLARQIGQTTIKRNSGRLYSEDLW